ncbi:MAG: glycosyltransferase family 2 protein [Actinobacteria bacterium]|nr:glycosyltransferase family 2 protein [Actinomycetota bacterium]
MIDQQGLADLEIIVLDDDSTDGTADTVRRGGRGGPLPTAQQVMRAPAYTRSPVLHKKIFTSRGLISHDRFRECAN